MSAPIIDQEASLESDLEEVSYTLVHLEAHPLTAGMAPEFKSMLAETLDVIGQEAMYRTDIFKGNALVAVADEDLDGVVDTTVKTLLIETGGNRTVPLYTMYVGTDRVSDLKRPVLGDELEKTRTWVPMLKSASSPALNALSEVVAAKVKAADDAIVALGDARRRNKEFRAVGARKVLVDKINALRKSTYGKLSELPYKYPEKNLPANFAERFFKHAPPKKSQAKAEPTVAELNAMIAESEAHTASLKKQLAEALVKDDAAAKAKEEMAAKKAALAEAQKAAEDALAKVAALKSALSAEM